MNRAKADCLLKKINYEPFDIRHFEIALTHSSYLKSPGSQPENNEKYEFLGDAVLGFTTAEYLFKRYPDKDEGFLTKTRARIICERNLALCARRMDLGSCLLLGKGEISTMGFDKPSILSDSFEAVIGAIYLDKGIESAQKFIEENVLIPFFRNGDCQINSDAKTSLQEKVQESGTADIRYQVVSHKGPDHNKVFSVELHIGNRIMGKGTGRSKKEAEQNAAREALKYYNNDNI